MARIDPIPELKRQVAAQLVALLDGWSAHNAAFLIGADQPRISDLRRGKLERFSLETLIRFVARMRYRVGVSFEKEPISKRAV